jgi:hypothetical protein
MTLHVHVSVDSWYTGGLILEDFNAEVKWIVKKGGHSSQALLMELSLTPRNIMKATRPATAKSPPAMSNAPTTPR